MTRVAIIVATYGGTAITITAFIERVKFKLGLVLSHLDSSCSVSHIECVFSKPICLFLQTPSVES